MLPTLDHAQPRASSRHDPAAPGHGRHLSWGQNLCQSASFMSALCLLNSTLWDVAPNRVRGFGRVFLASAEVRTAEPTMLTKTFAGPDEY